MARLRCPPPCPLLAVAMFAAAGTAPAQEVAASAAPPMAGLALSAESNSLATAAIELSNAGTAGKRLAFTVTPSATACHAASPIAWLAVEPSTGEIADGAVAVLSVYASAFGAVAPRRAGFLCIATGDAARPLREMPVVLTIKGRASPGE
jgi:hypothetical protein